MIIKFSSEDFNTEHIFDCGQCFRWEREADGSYTGTAGGRIANVRFAIAGECEKEPALAQANAPADSPFGEVIIEECDETADEGSRDFWFNYLDLERDYGYIKEELSRRDDVIGDAIRFGYGIRLLRQEQWETLVSFIISANNNIPRTKKNIECISSKFGEKIGTFRGKTYYDVPKPEVLAKLTAEDLAECRLGYRAGYLIKTAGMVAADCGCVNRECILDYCGVGPKVANCIELFSMEAYDSFPIDTWVEQVMKELYGIEGKKKIAEFASQTFGEYGGFAQQYLFYYMRSKG